MIDNPNPIFKMDWHSSPNPITIQLFLEKEVGQQIFNGQVLLWNPGIPKKHLSSTYNLTDALIVWKASLLEHDDALCNFNFLIKLFWDFGFGLKWQNWIDNSNPKSDFDFGLSIPIQSTKLDCNPDWAIQSINTLVTTAYDITLHKTLKPLQTEE